MEATFKSNEEVKALEIAGKIEASIGDGDSNTKKDKKTDTVPRDQVEVDAETSKFTIDEEEVSTREEVKAKIDFLNAQIGKRLNTFDSLRNQNCREAMVLRVLSSMLGAVITVLLGLKLGTGFEAIAVNVALVLGSIITIVNAWEVFWDPKPLWIRYTVTSNELRSLRSDLEYLTKKSIDRISVEEIDNLYERYRTILKETNKTWQKFRSEEGQKTET